MADYYPTPCTLPEAFDSSCGRESIDSACGPSLGLLGALSLHSFRLFALRRPFLYYFPYAPTPVPVGDANSCHHRRESVNTRADPSKYLHCYFVLSLSVVEGIHVTPQSRTCMHSERCTQNSTTPVRLFRVLKRRIRRVTCCSLAFCCLFSSQVWLFSA